jgi:cytochrome c-type biogenesis protein CcmE
VTRKQRRGILIGTCLAVLGVAVGLVLFAMRDSIVFFYSPSEVPEMGIAPGTRFRLGGLVETGSVIRPRRFRLLTPACCQTCFARGRA